jgi:hypothetical protein
MHVSIVSYVIILDRKAGKRFASLTIPSFQMEMERDVCAYNRMEKASKVSHIKRKDNPSPMQTHKNRFSPKSSQTFAVLVMLTTSVTELLSLLLLSTPHLALPMLHNGNYTYMPFPV